MKNISLIQKILLVGFVVGLSACSAISQPPLAPADAQQTVSMQARALLSPLRSPAATKSFACGNPSLPPASAYKKPLIYVASGELPGCVFIYRLGIQAPIGQITDGVTEPNGIFVDAKGNLYVANAYNAGTGTIPLNTTVTMYPQGKLKPSVTYTGLALPESVAVGSDGTVYIADALGSPSGGGIVREYRGGSTTPSASLTVPAAFAFAVALDKSNNLYVSWWTQDGAQTRVYEYAPGDTTGKDLNLILPKESVGSHSIAFDAQGNLVLPVEPGLNHNIQPEYLAVFAPGHRTPRKLWLGSLANLVFGVAFPTTNAHRVYITGQNGSNLLLLSYPGGLVQAVTPVGLAAGIALSTGT
jgi:hypothetical protein